MPNLLLILPAQQFFLLSSNGRQTVGDGAFYVDAAPSVLAVCHLQGADDMYYYSTTFSGGPGVRSSYTFHHSISIYFHSSGGFDVPKSKCPPDRGSSDCVTGSPALNHSSAFNPTFYSSVAPAFRVVRLRVSTRRVLTPCVLTRLSDIRFGMEPARRFAP